MRWAAMNSSTMNLRADQVVSTTTAGAATSVYWGLANNNWDSIKNEGPCPFGL